MVNCESGNAAAQWRSGAIEALGQAAGRSAGAAAEAYAENTSEDTSEQQIASHERIRHFLVPGKAAIFIRVTTNIYNVSGSGVPLICSVLGTADVRLHRQQAPAIFEASPAA